MIYVSFYECVSNYLCGMENCTEIKARQLKDFETLDRKAMVQLLAGTEMVSLPKGSLVFKENQQLNKLYCIRQGACKFSTVDKSGQEHILRFLGEGDIMGKRSIISNEGAKVSATTLTDTLLCCIDKTDVLEHVKSNPFFCNDLLNAFIEDVNINEHTRVVFCVHKGFKQRLASLLLYLAEKFGQAEDGRLLIKVKRDDMASVLGTSSEYVINLLNIFKSRGYIKILKREIYITSKTGLEKIN